VALDTATKESFLNIFFSLSKFFFLLERSSNVLKYNRTSLTSVFVTQSQFTGNNATDMTILNKYLTCNTFILMCMLPEIRE